MNTWLANLMKTRVVATATAPQVADALFTITLAIDTALVPMLALAVKQLFERTRASGAKTYPWMAEDCQDSEDRLDLEGLRLLFSQQTSDDAAGGAALLLQTFYDMLAAMIGVPMAEHLLRPVWANYRAP